jgi:hypothetical protein
METGSLAADGSEGTTVVESKALTAMSFKSFKKLSWRGLKNSYQKTLYRVDEWLNPNVGLVEVLWNPNAAHGPFSEPGEDLEAPSLLTITEPIPVYANAEGKPWLPAALGYAIKDDNGIFHPYYARAYC